MAASHPTAALQRAGERLAGLGIDTFWAYGRNWGEKPSGIGASHLQLRRTALLSDFGSLCENEGIFDVDAEMSDGVIDLRMAQQKLDRPQVAGGLEDHGCFGEAKRMGAVFGAPKSDGIDSLVDEPGIWLVLSGRHDRRGLGRQGRGQCLLPRRWS